METYVLSRGSLLGKVFFGLCLSLVSAFLGVWAGTQIPTAVIGILMIVELVMIVVAMFMQRRRAIGMPFVLAFTFISGITLWPTLHYYAYTLGAAVVLKAIGVSAGAFLVAAVVASRTSFDFSFLGGFLLVGLLAVLGMGVVSLFIGFSTMAELIYSLLGIAIFIGYVLFDVNRIAHNGIAERDIPWVVLSLYLDFVNLLLFVLRLFGVLQSDRR
ncbi:Bax inhibitor-1 family protein [Alicyclobacillus pomorum]|jgi:FtsH-binding integral membrane protein|uniref:Bax inhibitor-1/YccA family protein n=1 Tax=Alicyclobacillus pomorum TaxID=204470 RepID=UPI000406468D|nr:Bax inhibitor-1 family protein [Alicyclobacillus pomorum]